MLDIRTIYHEPTVNDYARGREILARYPDAERIEVPSHWNIPTLHGDPARIAEWVQTKQNTLVLGVKKGLSIESYERSADFIAPSQANGCSMACAYCVEVGTLIATPTALVPVEQIQDGDEVLAYDSSSERLVPARVVGVASRQVDEVLEIQVGDRVLRVTAEHPIMTRRGWVQAGHLTEDDEVIYNESADITAFHKITSIKRVQTNTTVHNFHVPGHESYVANGIVTHNCYVPRRKGFANPITTFINIEQIMAAIRKHANKQGMKLTPTDPDPSLWVYELGTNSDCGFDAEVSDNMKDLVALFRDLPNAKATFSTKTVNRMLLDYDPQRRSRLRFSLMPTRMSKLVDVRTAPIDERIAAINDFYDAGYEININFAPVIVYDGWLEDYARLFQQIDDTLSQAVKDQLTTEIVFLTHNEDMHEVNMGWHPKAEEVLWRPEIQERKVSGTGGVNLRYKVSIKRKMVSDLLEVLNRHMPYCKVRYAF